MSSTTDGDLLGHTPEFAYNDLELLLNSSQDMIVCLKPDCTFRYANAAYKEMALQVYGKEILYAQTSFLDFIPHFLLAHYKELLANVLAGETVANETYRSYPNKNLPDAYFDEVFKPILDKNNAIDAISIFIKDITKNYRLENKLAEREAILRGVFESGPDEILSINKRNEVTSYNKGLEDTYLKLIGKKITLGMNVLKFFDLQGFEHLVSTFKRRFERGLKGEKFAETDTYEIDGVKFYKEIFVNPLLINESVIGVSLFARDITQKIYQEKKGMENELFLKSVQNMAQIGTWRHNLKTGDFVCSNYCFEIFGIIPSAKPSKELFDGMLGQENVQKIQTAISDFLKNGKRASFDMQLTFSTHYAKYLTCIINPSLTATGELLEIICVLQDISTRIKTQKELDKANDFLATILDASDYAITTTDQSGTITSMNQSAEKILGYKGAELIGKADPTLWHDAEELKKQGKSLSKELGMEINFGVEILLTKSRRGLKNETETQYISKNGQKTPISLVISPLLDKKKNITGFVAIAKDITEKVAYEQRLKFQNALLSATINSLPFDFWARDLTQKMIIQNAKSISYWGDTFNVEFAEQNVSSEIIQHWKSNNDRALEGETVRHETKFVIHGNEIYMDEIVAPIFDENNNVTGILGINIDINDRKIAELNLQKAYDSERKLSSALETALSAKVEREQKLKLQELRFTNVINSNLLDAILVLNSDLMIVGFNYTYQHVMWKNYSIALKIGKFSIFDLLPAQFHADYQKIFSAVLAGKYQMKETPHSGPNGNVFHSTESFYPIYDNNGEVAEIAVFLRDGTEAIASRKIIEESELKFRLITDATNEASYDHNLLNNEISWFGGFEKLFGTGRNEKDFNFLFWIDAIHPEDKNRVATSYQQNLSNSQSNTWTEEYRIIDQKGEIKFVIDKAAYIRNENGDAIKALGGMQDITHRKLQEERIATALKLEQALSEELTTREEELTTSEEQLKNLVNELSHSNARLAKKESQMRAMVNSTKDIVLLVDNDLNLQFFNDTYKKRVKAVYNVDAKEGDPVFKYMRPRESELYKGIITQLSNGGAVNLNHYVEEADIYREEYFNPIIDPNGDVSGYAVFLRDVSAKVKSQKKLEESALLLKETQIAAQTGSWKYEMATGNITWTDCTYLIYGVALDKAISFELVESLYSESNNIANYNIIMEAFNKRLPYKIDSYYTAPDGTEKYLVAYGNPLFDEQGNFKEYIGFVQDITDRKKIELSLARSLDEAQKLNEILANNEAELTSIQEELRTYLEEVYNLNSKLEENEILLNKNIQLLNLTSLLNKVGGWEYDVVLDKYYHTDQMYLMLGMKIGDDLSFKTTVTFYSPEDAKILREKFDNLLQKGDPYDHEMQMTTVKGEKIWVRSVGYAAVTKGKVMKAFGIVQDITKRKRDQQKLIDSETNLKAIINNTDFGIWAVDTNYRIIAFNDVFEREYGLHSSANAKIGMNLFKNVKTAKDTQQLKVYYDRAFNGEKFTKELAVGDVVFESYFSPIINADGSVRGVAVINIDISSRKKIEKQIKLSELKFRALFEKSKVSMMLFDKQTVIDCNPQTLNLFQISDKTELNSIILPLLQQSGFKRFALTNIDKKRSENSQTNKEQTFEWTHIRKDGNRLYGEISFTPIEIDGEDVLFSQFYDITERKTAEIKITESKNFLNSIIDNIPIGMMIIDEYGEVQRMNSAILSLTGIPENWFDRGGINFTNDPFLAQIGVRQIFQTALNGGIVINEELKIDFGLSINEWKMREDVAWFLVTAFPIQENLNTTNVVVSLIDITVDKMNEEKIRLNAIELMASDMKMSEYKLMALRSVMNPHFLFNSLNSIQYFIAKNEREQALNYLSLFSKLIRSILNSSIQNLHSLAEEISILRFYTDLETLRFENKFKTTFEFDSELDQESIEIPSLILQPYVENAILHGLYNKEGEEGVLSISFRLTNEENLLAIIEDNGVGRLEALEIKQASNMPLSVGMLVTQERLELINKDNNLKVKIIDLNDENGRPSGTRVEVQFKIYSD